MSQSSPPPDNPTPRRIHLPLERDLFLRTLIRELSGTLEELVGVDEASGFVSVVGQRVGAWIEQEYRREMRGPWSREQIAEVLVDLKRRIQGDFSIESIDEEKIVLNNRACPFGDKVLGRPSMCMMTSNVFGHITAKHVGYARVALDETIAGGNARCRVTIYLNPRESPVIDHEREYFKPDGEL